MKQATDMETWLRDNPDMVFRFLVYRRMFTPDEQDAKYSDETFYENGGAYQYGIIEDAVDLGGGEWLLGIRIMDDETLYDEVNYYRLSEIRLFRFKADQEMPRGGGGDTP